VCYLAARFSPNFQPASRASLIPSQTPRGSKLREPRGHCFGVWLYSLTGLLRDSPDCRAGTSPRTTAPARLLPRPPLPAAQMRKISAGGTLEIGDLRHNLIHWPEDRALRRRNLSAVPVPYGRGSFGSPFLILRCRLIPSYPTRN